MSKLQWKTWKEDKNIIDKFLEDYNLTLLEAAVATTESTTSKTFVDYKKNPEKASLYFLNKLSEFTDTPIKNLFEIESTTIGNFNIENKMDKINEFHKGMLYSVKTKKNANLMQTLYHLLGSIHLPIISSIGDEFSGKRKIFSDFEPCLNKDDFKNSVCFVVNEDFTLKIFENVFGIDKIEEYQSTKFIRLKNQNEKVFNPHQIINEYYLEKWESTNDKDNFIIIFSKNNLFKNFTLIDYPEYKYEESQKHRIQATDINLLIKYQYFADFCFYFGAISRFSTILDTPILKFLFKLSEPQNIKLLATKTNLRKDITNLEFAIQEIQLKNNNSYSLDIPLSFNFKNFPKENIIKYNKNSFLEHIDDFLDTYLANIDTNLNLDEAYSFFVQILSSKDEMLPSNNDDMESIKKELIQIFDELYITIIGDENRNSITVISEWIKELPVEQNLNKKIFTELLDFMYEYINENTDKRLKSNFYMHIHIDLIVSSLFLYFVNIILPFINSEKSFSKGTPETWEKKIAKKINISKELYNSFIKNIISIFEV